MNSDEHVVDMKAKDMSERNLEAPIDDLTISETEVLSEEQNKRLRLKADLVVLPLMVIASTLAFLDKVSFLAFGALPHFIVNSLIEWNGIRSSLRHEDRRQPQRAGI